MKMWQHDVLTMLSNFSTLPVQATKMWHQSKISGTSCTFTPFTMRKVKVSEMPLILLWFVVTTLWQFVVTFRCHNFFDLCPVVTDAKGRLTLISKLNKITITAVTENCQMKGSLRPIDTKRQCQRCDNSVMTLQNRFATHFQASPLILMRTESLASSRSCRSIDADAWYKQTLITGENVYFGGFESSRPSFSLIDFIAAMTVAGKCRDWKAYWRDVRTFGHEWVYY